MKNEELAQRWRNNLNTAESDTVWGIVVPSVNGIYRGTSEWEPRPAVKSMLSRVRLKSSLSPSPLMRALQLFPQGVIYEPYFLLASPLIESGTVPIVVEIEWDRVRITSENWATAEIPGVKSIVEEIEASIEERLNEIERLFLEVNPQIRPLYRGLKMESTKAFFVR